jgi:hypothetical protein
VVADSYHFDEEQDLDPDPYLSEELDIWISIKVKKWIRIRIKMMRIRNHGPVYEPKCGGWEEVAETCGVSVSA